MVDEAVQAEFQHDAQAFAQLRSERITMKTPEQRAVLHAEVDRIIIEHLRVAGVPAEVAVGAVSGFPVLHLLGCGGERADPVRVNARLCIRQHRREEFATAIHGAGPGKFAPGAVGTGDEVRQDLFARHLRGYESSRTQQQCACKAEPASAVKGKGL
ncbi:MAG: hypothetical protein BWX70_02850 [Verrucomicrobia bacterium ADurb.Bin070]|nr:MAG: hypothetical protein BWX70_02850 [Verrucomicrobia bacterium ADurb.Bin070]